MQPPAGNTGCGVERGLRFRPAAKGRSALAGEDERQLLALVRALDIGREGVRKLACWLAQRYEMRNPVLGSRGWYRPSRPKVRPTSSSIISGRGHHMGDFACRMARAPVTRCSCRLRAAGAQRERAQLVGIFVGISALHIEVII